MSNDVSKSLLDLQPLSDPGSHGQFESAVFYVVLGSGDYQISWATLLQTINKTRLQLNNVDNTSDANKPISLAQEQAFDLKADRDNVPSNSDFAQLAQIVSQKLAITTFDDFVGAVNNALYLKLTTESFQTWLNENYVPLVEQNGQLAVDLGNLIQDLSTNYTTTTGMNLAISNSAQVILTEVDTRLETAMDLIALQIASNLQTTMNMFAEDRTRLQNIEQQAISIGQQIATQVTQLTDHEQRITGLESFVADGVKFVGTSWQ